MEKYPQPAVEPASLTTNNDIIIVATSTDTISTNNVMWISEHGIEGNMPLSNSLFVEEEH